MLKTWAQSDITRQLTTSTLLNDEFHMEKKKLNSISQELLFKLPAYKNTSPNQFLSSVAYHGGTLNISPLSLGENKTKQTFFFQALYMFL